MKVYLDMDGLLANLFDYVGMIVYKKHYENLTSSEKEDIKKIWANKESFFSLFPPLEELFTHLKPFPTNDALIKEVIKHFGEFYVLTCPSNLDYEGCKNGKSKWIEKHIASKYGEHFRGVIFAKDKSNYATDEDGSPNILIDDYPPFVNKWNEAGGIGIRLQSNDFSTDKEIVYYLNSELAKGLKKLK